MNRSVSPIPRPQPGHLAVDRRLYVPPWVHEQTGLSEPAWDLAHGDRFCLHMTEGEGLSLVSVRVVGAGELSAEQFRSATVHAYQAVFERLGEQYYPVRFWNFLPAIHQEVGDGRNQYMIFNGGRFEAFEGRYGGREAFDRQVATATAVGHDSADLMVHCLASRQPGRHVGNPRQISPHCYSEKFGPLPPCFARATMVPRPGNASLLLVGGTASIRGEDSQHIGDLQQQCDETLRNLSAVVTAGATVKFSDRTSPLSCFRELRVYHPRSADAKWLGEHLPANFPHLRRMELCRADLCRSELLVEIEGVAMVEMSSNPS